MKVMIVMHAHDIDAVRPRCVQDSGLVMIQAEVMGELRLALTRGA